MLLLGAVAFVSTSRAGYETADYSVKESDGDFELREYGELAVVSTPMTDEARNGAFGRLFEFISGKNSAEEKIAMTTPVFMPAGENGEPEVMQFVLPAEVAKREIPDPKNEKVKIEQMKAGTYAVVRYSGLSKKGDREKHLKKLLSEIEERGLEQKGDPIFAGYDPPWTPGPMRRNEVLIPVGEK